MYGITLSKFFLSDIYIYLYIHISISIFTCIYIFFFLVVVVVDFGHKICANSSMRKTSQLCCVTLICYHCLIRYAELKFENSSVFVVVVVVKSCLCCIYACLPILGFSIWAWSFLLSHTPAPLTILVKSTSLMVSFYVSNWLIVIFILFLFVCFSC